MVKNMPNIVMDLITIMGFPGGSYGKESACNAGYLVSIPCYEYPLEEDNPL